LRNVESYLKQGFSIYIAAYLTAKYPPSKKL